MALCSAGVQVELREVLLKDKPAAMLVASSQGTVPVLVREDGTVLDESYDGMRWALGQQDPDGWWDDSRAEEIDQLLQQNDIEFKPWLDRYKYAVGYPALSAEYYRAQGELFLQVLEAHLEYHAYLLRDILCFADVAIFPFVRQFAFVDKDWFDSASYPRLQSWLETLLASELFLAVMAKYPVWQEGDRAQLFPA